MIVPLSLVVNGKSVEAGSDPGRSLLDFLRNGLGLAGTKDGCGKGHCGSCAVVVAGKAARACRLKLGDLEGADVLTIEGLAAPGSRGTEGLHPLQRAFLAEGAVQCGFCAPGMLMAAYALLASNADPSPDAVRAALAGNLCRCTGYAPIERAVLLAARSLREGFEIPLPPSPAAGEETVGVSVLRADAVAKVRGEPVFADDLAALRAARAAADGGRGPLVGRLLFSARTRARILSVDVSAARAAPGVALVLTAADVPGRNAFGLFEPQQPVLAAEEVAFLGDVVAAVFAEDAAAAERALGLIKVEYEALPALRDAAANLKPGAEAVRRGAASNEACRVACRRGDADAAFRREGLVVVEGHFSTQAVEHAYLETEACLAEGDGSGGVVVYTANQGSVAYRDMIAASLGLDPSKVRVVLAACGGAFGGKEEPTVQIHAALAALRTGRAVRIALSRADSIRASTKRHPTEIDMARAADADGRLVAVRSRVLADAGAYLSQTRPVVFRAAVTAAGPYACPNVDAEAVAAYTNRPPSGAFRGFGSTQACFAAEVQMDELARALGLDPVEFRRRNALGPRSRTATGQVLGAGAAFPEVLEAAGAALARLKAEFPSPRTPGAALGFGLACSYKNVGIGAGTPDGAGAVASLEPGGRVLVRTGAADLGQGSGTLAAQIAARELGVPYALVDAVACDTATCPDGGMTTASRQTFVSGNAVKGAAAALRALLGDRLQAPFDSGALEAARRACLAARLAPEASFRYVPPVTRAHREDALEEGSAEDGGELGIHYSYCWAAAAVAVEVDRATGRIRPLKVAAVQDLGKAVHPANARGQVEGAVAMGLGYALSEEYADTETEVLTADLLALGVPRIRDVPPVEVVLVEKPEEAGPYGAKGMGEVGLNPVAPAVSNAVFDAVGVRLRKLPMRPMDVLSALGGGVAPGNPAGGPSVVQ